jgi:hypothetical protein
MTSPSDVDPIPLSAYPKLNEFTGRAPLMPPSWTATVLLHPFSPPQSTDPKPDTPFFQLCVAKVWLFGGGQMLPPYFVAQVVGTEYGTWWYRMYGGKTEVSRDRGITWNDASGLNWDWASGWFGTATPECAGTSPLNWMSTQPVEWWKVPVPIPDSKVSAATWMWFDSATRYPVRMMYGYGPPKPTVGDPSQLPLFQMYSFTYFASFETRVPQYPPSTWENPSIEGFAVGNPKGYKPFVWNSNFGMTAFMTPVNEAFNPLPTRVLYVWKPDADYSVASDRAQNTLMLYTYNRGATISEEALLFGPVPATVPPPPDSDTGFLITNYRGGKQKCDNFGFAQQPPDWVSIPEVQGTIRATISNHPVLCPGTTVTVYSVLFPPSQPNYPESTYLWTWYAPTPGSDGTDSRPVTFMQSQSGVGVGTSLALADYFDYELLSEPISPANFTVPQACSGQNQTRRKTRGALRFRLP